MRLDPATKQPKGQPFLVAAFHSRRRTFGGAQGYAVTKDWIIWALTERTGNLFFMEQDVPAADQERPADENALRLSGCPGRPQPANPPFPEKKRAKRSSPAGV